MFNGKGGRLLKKSVLYNTGNNVLFDKIDPGENFLILYSNTESHKKIFLNFINQMEKDSIIFYISHIANKLELSPEIRTYSFNIISETIINDLKDQLDKCFADARKNNKNLLLISDWSNTNLSNCDIFIPFLKDLIKESQSLNSNKWRKYKKTIPCMIIDAFETTRLNTDLFKQILSLHKRVFFLQEKINAFLLPALLASSNTFSPKYYVLPQAVLEKLVKDNLEILALILLEKDSKSGYQILKDIASHFHCILSQGTLYPLLYQLEKENKIIKKKGKGREVIYTLTGETREDLKSRKETYLKSYEHLANFLNKGDLCQIEV